MSVASIKSPQEPVATKPAVARSASDGNDFAAVAREAAASSAAAPAAPAPVPAPAAPNVAALAGLLAQGDLAAARAALEQLGAHPAFADPDSTAKSTGQKPAAPVTTSTAAASQVKVADVGSVASQSGEDIDVHQVLLALATGNAGSIPADVINLYGPGGARYDPAAIMDAYRASTLGQAQMAALASWVGKLA